MEILSCNAPYNEGGLGKILAVLVEEARSGEKLDCYYTSRKKFNDPLGREVSLKRFRWLFRAPLVRDSLGWKEFLAADLFDRVVARRLTPAGSFRGFSGRAQHSFIRARQLEHKLVVLESPTSHIGHVRRQHHLAKQLFPFEKSWLNKAQYEKCLREYEMADLIYVISEYARQTFLEASIPESKLRRRVVTVESRFAPPIRTHPSDSFTIVYVGRLQTTKGLQVLLEAFKRLPDKDAELILVGGYGTNSMEKYLRRRLTADRRIKLRPGDPLPYLHRANVVVHPSFEDGLGFAPLEALACGVPVIVTEDTGMKEYVVNGRNGYVLPTGDIDALVEQLRDIRSRPLKGTFEPLSLFPNAESVAF